MENLRTPRLLLRAASPEAVAAAAENDHNTLSRRIQARVSGDWPPRVDDDGRRAREGFKFVHDVLRRHPMLMGWWGWFVILQEPEPVLIGMVSPKGPPTADGMVEVSYGIVTSQQGKGFATEATLGLMDWVRKDPRVRKIVAETLPERAASIGVMEKCGMTFLGEGSERGTIRYGVPVVRP